MSLVIVKVINCFNFHLRSIPGGTLSSSTAKKVRLSHFYWISVKVQLQFSRVGQRVCILPEPLPWFLIAILTTEFYTLIINDEVFNTTKQWDSSLLGCHKERGKQLIVFLEMDSFSWEKKLTNHLFKWKPNFREIS